MIDGNFGNVSAGVFFFESRVSSETVVFVSMTTFSILVGSARAYLSRNGAITWVSNYRYPIC